MASSASSSSKTLEGRWQCWRHSPCYLFLGNFEKLKKKKICPTFFFLFFVFLLIFFRFFDKKKKKIIAMNKRCYDCHDNLPLQFPTLQTTINGSFTFSKLPINKSQNNHLLSYQKLSASTRFCLHHKLIS